MTKSNARGCGDARTAGGIYLEVASSADGAPVEFFMVCPPVPVDLQDLGISPIGTHLIQQGDTHHVFDVVGSEHYPNIADFVEEGRHIGFSRRCSLKNAAEYAKLSTKSRINFIHRRGYIHNFAEYNPIAENLSKLGLECPRGRANHNFEKGLEQMCCGLFYADVEGDMIPHTFYQEGTDNLNDPEEFAKLTRPDVYACERELPCGEKYTAYKPTNLEIDKQYQYALFLSLPLGRVVLVDPDNEYSEKLDLVAQCGLPVEVVDE